MRGLGWTLAILLAVVLVLIAWIHHEGRPPHGRAQYVAMGSSFAAGPAITTRAADSPWFCARSQDNYAHQLARLRQLSLVDVSCGGATTRHILGGGFLMLPPQLDAVTSDTELVTITIGGNDIDYIGNMMALGCDASTPWYLRRVGACRSRSVGRMEQDLRDTALRMGRIVDEIHRRAPKAKVVLVTYQTVLPDQGTCERLGLSDAQVAQMRDIADQLADTTRRVAQQHGALLLDAASLTHGHDVCAADAWMNGMRPSRGLLGAPLHPTLAAMTAIAQALDALLDQAPPAS
ncbi:SGNH/GDSL hydrolase family protein [Solimonas terrae]|nr:SGNH/GDSL hydrolase family protein [Solimonas terrae]